MTRPVPENYRRIEASERRPAPGTRVLRESDPTERLAVVIRVKASAGPSGLDQVAAFACAQDLVLVGTNTVQQCVVLWGTVARLSEVFAVQLSVYEAPAGSYRGWDGHLHLPAGLAECVENVHGLCEGEIDNFEHWLCGILGHSGGGPGHGGSGPGHGGSGPGHGGSGPGHGGSGSGEPKKSPIQVFDLIVPPSGPQGAVNPGAFSMVQEFDVDWFSDPGFQRLLDNMAASPGAFKTVRVMKVFTNGGTAETGILGTTTAPGTVWPANVSSASIDFTVTLNALAEITSRGLIPFVVLSFFPDGIYFGTPYQNASPGPIGPVSSDSRFNASWPAILGNWTTLVQAFFDALILDTTRFGPTAIAQWWFEVWNEPDDGSFWNPDSGSGNLTYYQDLYKATSAAVTSKGYNIRLGGPTIMGPNVVGANTTIPGTIPTLMSGFIDFVMGNGTPANQLKCDFLSFHAKGCWTACLNGDPTGNPTPASGQIVGPSLQSAIDAADQTAWFAKNAGLKPITVVNDEADMRVFFAVPFRPRMTEQFPAWLTALLIAYDSLGSEYSPNGIQFMAGSDNAELQLVGWTETTIFQNQGRGVTPVLHENASSAQFAAAAFGQQRSIMTAASTGGPSNSNSWVKGTCPIDLLKVPVYNFYELLRLLGDQHGTFLTGQNNYYPHNSDLFHLISTAATHIGSVFCVYPPNPPSGASQSPWSLNYSIVGIPWPTFNWYQFQIDGTNSNGFQGAGGPLAEPVATLCSPPEFPKTALPLIGLDVVGVRKVQELSVVAQAVNFTPATAGRFDAPALNLPAYTTTVFWITQYQMDIPTTPVWIGPNPPTLDTTPTGTNVVLRWQPNTDPTFYTYQVARDQQNVVVSPGPLRAAMWIDTNPAVGRHTYWVRALSASGVPSSWSSPMTVTIT